MKESDDQSPSIEAFYSVRAAVESVEHGDDIGSESIRVTAVWRGAWVSGVHIQRPGRSWCRP